MQRGSYSGRLNGLMTDQRASYPIPMAEVSIQQLNWVSRPMAHSSSSNDCTELGAYCGTVGAFTPTGGSVNTRRSIHLRPCIIARAGFTNTAPLDPYQELGDPKVRFKLKGL